MSNSEGAVDAREPSSSQSTSTPIASKISETGGKPVSSKASSPDTQSSEAETVMLERTPEKDEKMAEEEQEAVKASKATPSTPVLNPAAAPFQPSDEDLKVLQIGGVAVLAKYQAVAEAQEALNASLQRASRLQEDLRAANNEVVDARQRVSEAQQNLFEEMGTMLGEMKALDDQTGSQAIEKEETDENAAM